MIFIVHLKSTSKNIDSYQRKDVESDLIKNTQKDIKNIFEIERILAKKSIKAKRSRISKIQYKVK